MPGELLFRALDEAFGISDREPSVRGYVAVKYYAGSSQDAKVREPFPTQRVNL